MSWISFLLNFLLGLGQLDQSWSLAPIVTIRQGSLQGIELQTRGGRKFHSFLGIPFAEKPEGELRFKDPQPHQGWEGILNATTEKAVCLQEMRLLQSLQGITVGSEDCLYLNVHTPYYTIIKNYTSPKPKKKLPVMVWIFGGAWVQGGAGSDTNGPTYILDRDVVYVNFNHRVGALGFLSTESTTVPGNQALKDQQLALQWVKKNIEAFGGDAEAITIFGESSGAVSVHFQLIAPNSQGIFNKAIIQSGSAFCEWALIAKGLAKKNFGILASRLNCTGNDDKKILTCLRKLPAESILKADLSFLEWSIDPLRSFAPVIESNHPKAFITRHPLEYPKPTIPIIIGVNHDEGAFRTSRFCSNNFLELNQLNENRSYYLPLSLLFRESVEKQDVAQVVQNVTQFYLQGKTVDQTNLRSLSDVYSDFYFIYGTIKATEYFDGPVYFYLYNHVGQFTWAPLFGTPGCPVKLGVCHGDEMFLMFNIKAAYGNYNLTGNDLIVSKTLLALWTNFATTGIPTDDKKQINWPVFDASSSRKYLYIGDSEFTIKYKPVEERFRFVQSLPLALQRLEKSLGKN